MVRALPENVSKFRVSTLAYNALPSLAEGLFKNLVLNIWAQYLGAHTNLLIPKFGYTTINGSGFFKKTKQIYIQNNGNY